MIIADDNVREWGTRNYMKKAADYTDKGYAPISMKNDFAQIFPDGITAAEEQYYPSGIQDEVLDPAD